MRAALAYLLRRAAVAAVEAASRIDPHPPIVTPPPKPYSSPLFGGTGNVVLRYRTGKERPS